jgi:hypothetical protein
VDFHDPGQVLTALNDAFQMERHNNMYFTIWYGVYDTAARSLRRIQKCLQHRRYEMDRCNVLPHDDLSQIDRVLVALGTVVVFPGMRRERAE